LTHEEVEIIADAVDCAVGMAIFQAPKEYSMKERMRWVEQEYGSVLKAQSLLDKLRQEATPSAPAAKESE
jgi:hypothetical protein